MSANYTYGGALSLNCPWYVERREDQFVFSQLARGGNCYVLTSHQMGKSSLVVRLVDKLRKAGLQAVVIDLAAFGTALTAEQWYHALAQRVAQQLRLEDVFDKLWSNLKSLPPSIRFNRAVEQITRAAGPGPFVFFVDEIDLLGSLPFSPDDFLQTVHAAAPPLEPGAETPDRPGYCLLGTVAPEGLWRESGRAACPLGRVILLRDFAREEVWQVAGRLARQFMECPEICWPDQLYAPEFILEQTLDRVFYWTSGHPYLTQILGCAATHLLFHQLTGGTNVLATHCAGLVDHCCERLFTHPASREQDAHLLWVRRCLLSSDLSASQILDSRRPARGGSPRLHPGDDDAQRWRTSGIVRVRNGQVQWRNRIYERVFGARWACDGRHAGPTQPRAPDTAGAGRGEFPISALRFLEPTLQAALSA